MFERPSNITINNIITINGSADKAEIGRAMWQAAKEFSRQLGPAR
jgi:hypothetical protein